MSDPKCQVQSVFCRALECGSAQERAAWLAQACAGDSALRFRVEDLLRAHDQAGDFLRGRVDPSATPTAEATVAEQPGSVIGPYQLREPLGAGGMGVVFLAEQNEPVRRPVALKIIKPGLDSRQVIA